MDVIERSDWSAAGEAELDGVVALRRAIHADPELGLDCGRTAAKIREALAGLPLELREGPSTSGLVAILRGGGDNGRSVLLRGDMDALPVHEETGLDFASRSEGLMHACGHDTHTAMLVGAARALCARRETLPGTVRAIWACRAITTSQATGIGSRLSCGIAAWPPLPRMVAWSVSAEASRGPARPATVPRSIVGQMWRAKAASGRRPPATSSSRPSSSMKRAP